MQMIKKNWAYLLLLLAIVFFINKKYLLPNNSLEVKTIKVDVKTIKVEKGWGYEIYKDGELFISQKMIPAEEGFKHFTTKEQAQKVADLVAEKIKQGKGGGLPQITIEELDSLKIIR